MVRALKEQHMLLGISPELVFVFLLLFSGARNDLIIPAAPVSELVK